MSYTAAEKGHTSNAGAIRRFSGELAPLPLEGAEEDEANSRDSFDVDLDETWAASSKAETSKSSVFSQSLGTVTKWVDDYKTRKSGYGPPYYAEYGGDLPVDCDRMYADLSEVDELLRNGADPNVGHPEDHGLTPIHFAARFGNVKLLKMLKRAGGNPGITNALGLTPLSYTCAFKLSMNPNDGGALESRQMGAIRWLLEQGADPNHVDKAGYTPLSWACRSGIFPAVVALVDAGGDVMQRRPLLPGGSQVRLPKVDPLAVTCDKRIQRCLQAEIDVILGREAALMRRDVKQDSRKVRLKAVQAAIAKRQEARRFVIEEKVRVRHMEELGLELMRVDQAELARKSRRDMLRLLKVSPGIWTRLEAAPIVDRSSAGESGSSPTSPGTKAGRRRPRWVFDTTAAASKMESHAHDVLEQARQVEAFIINGDSKQKILTPRWRAMTGKRLLRLKHGRYLDDPKKGKRRQGHEEKRQGHGVGDGVDGEGDGDGSAVVPLSGLEEEGSESSSSSSSSSDGGGGDA